MVKLLQSNLNVHVEDNHIIPEQKLWKAVLCQMLYDALSDFENKAMNVGLYIKQKILLMYVLMLDSMLIIYTVKLINS